MEGKPHPNDQELPPGIEQLETGATVKFVAASKEKLPTVVIVHGWRSPVFKETGSYEEPRQLLRESNYHTLSLSLRGHQYSQGDIEQVTRAQHKEDIIAAFEYLKTKSEVDLTKLGAFGVSYGAYMLAVLSSQLPIQRLAMRVPALYPDKGWDTPTQQEVKDPALPEWREVSHTPEENLALGGVSGFRGDILLVSSQYDEDMPPAIPRSYEKAAQHAHVEHVEIQEAQHVLNSSQREEFRAILTHWFKDHYPTTSS